MTALERELTTALRALSAQYAQAQQQQATQADTLARQVAQLNGHVTDLAQDLTAQAFAPRLSWNDMEPIGVFAGRMPAGVSGGPVGATGNTRKFQYDFPGGGAIILLARPCERGRGLCVWSVDVE